MVYVIMLKTMQFRKTGPKTHQPDLAFRLSDLDISGCIRHVVRVQCPQWQWYSPSGMPLGHFATGPDRTFALYSNPASELAMVREAAYYAPGGMAARLGQCHAFNM